MDESHKFYGVIEIMMILCELLASIIVGEKLVVKLSESLRYFTLTDDIIVALAISIVTIILSYILVVFGAVLPKKIAKNNPEKIAFKVINIVWIVSKLNYPFEKLILFSVKLLSKIFGIKENSKDKLTEKEIKMIITEAQEQGIITKLEKEILFNTLKYDDILVKNIMIPKEKIDFINIQDSKEKILENIEEYKYTRIPVYEKTKDNVIGIFNVKDIAVGYAKNKKVKLDLKICLEK